MNASSDHSLPLHDVRAILAVLTAYFMFSTLDGVTKFIALLYTPVIIIFWQSVFRAIFMGVFVLATKGWHRLRTRRLKYHIIKSLYNLCNSLLIVYSLKHTALAEFYLAMFTTPLWIVLFSIVLLKEKFDKVRIGIVLLGFAIIAATVTEGGSFEIGTGIIAALIAAMGIGFNMIFIRKYLREESPALISGLNALTYVVILGGFALPQFNATLMGDMPFFIAAGLCGFIGAVLLARSYQLASIAAILAPFQYVQIVYGVLIGYFVFAEMPTSRTLLGATALVCLGLMLFWYDYNNNKKLRRYVGYTAES